MRSGRPSYFAAASWVVPFFIFVLMTVYDMARPRKQPLGLVPDLGPVLIALGVTAGLAFTLGLLSFILRERLCWLAAIPCILGGVFVCRFVLLPVLFWISGFVLREMPVDFIAGILLVSIGVLFLARWLPKLSALLAREQEADDVGETDTRMKVKVVKVFGIATLVVGIAFILIHAFHLF